MSIGRKDNSHIVLPEKVGERAVQVHCRKRKVVIDGYDLSHTK